MTPSNMVIMFFLTLMLITRTSRFEFLYGTLVLFSFGISVPSPEAPSLEAALDSHKLVSMYDVRRVSFDVLNGR